MAKKKKQQQRNAHYSDGDTRTRFARRSPQFTALSNATEQGGYIDFWLLLPHQKCIAMVEGLPWDVLRRIPGRKDAKEVVTPAGEGVVF